MWYCIVTGKANHPPRRNEGRKEKGMDRYDFLEYGIEFGREAAADLLLLCGPDGYIGTDYDELMELLTNPA